MKTSKKGLDYIIEEEGCISYEYYCPALVPTIGVGCVSKYIDDEIKSTFKRIAKDKIKTVGKVKPVIDKDGLVMTATKSQIMDLFLHRLATFENAVNEKVSVKLTQYQFDALVSFCFNIGVSNFNRSTLLKKINSMASDDEIKKYFSVWNKSKGKVLPVLNRRRKREYSLFLNGIYK